ncbi:hypothetical protein HDU90_005065 [Geranomyces variabilis]|nr:hypothetical protein HDU90_005065 [Geranomyces variabilis]
MCVTNAANLPTMSVNISHHRMLPRLQRQCCCPSAFLLSLRRTRAYASSSSSSSSSFSSRASSNPPASKPNKSSPKRREFHPLPTDTTRFHHHALYSTPPTTPFPTHTAALLSRPVATTELEIDQQKGYLYLSEPTYHTLLNTAFGANDDGVAWQLIPLSPFHTTSTGKTIYRAYSLLVNKQFVSEAIGDASIVNDNSVDDVEEAKRRCDYVALVRCGKDLGIASELWDPRTVNGLRAQVFEQKWVVDEATQKKKRVWVRK